MDRRILLAEIRDLFEVLRDARTEEIFLESINEFREKLLALEESLTDSEPLIIDEDALLFFDIFQFERLSSLAVWNELPRLYPWIGQVIEQQNLNGSYNDKENSTHHRWGPWNRCGHCKETRGRWI